MKASETIEIILWEKLRSGNTEALGELYDLFIDTLFSYGVQYSSDKHYVMDCIHDLFLDLHKYKRNLSPSNNVKYYLFRSLKNKILKKDKAKLILFTNDLSTNKGDDNNYSKSFEDEIIAQEYFDDAMIKLSKAITFLSKRQRHTLLLRYTEEKEYEEIAKIMEVTVQTSRTIVYRAIKELKKHLTELILLIHLFF